MHGSRGELWQGWASCGTLALFYCKCNFVQLWMMSRPTLKPALRSERAARGLAAWVVNIPPSLSDTGKRRQLFYDTQREANAACESIRTRQANFGITLAQLSPERIAEAAEAYKLLDAWPSQYRLSLVGIVQQHLNALRTREQSITFGALFDLFIAAKQNRSPRYRRELAITKNRFPALQDKLVPDLTHADVESALCGLTPGARNPVMRYFKAVFEYGIKRGYLTENPVKRLDFAVVKRTEVETVPASSVAAMLAHALDADLELLPFLVLGFFCGIRPDGELQRLEWRDVKFSDHVVVIRPEISKTSRRRFIDLSTNAERWLKVYSERRGGELAGRVVKFTSSQLRTHRTINRRAAGVTRWPNSAMRHTYCSCWLAVHRDVNKLVLMSGLDNPDTMWRHYYQGVSREDAQRFWDIVPPVPAANVIAFAEIS